MPKVRKYEPFTKQEKEQILRRHKELVDLMNKKLPADKKLSYDQDLEKRLDDPKVYGIYRIGQEIKEIKTQQENKRKELEAKFGKTKLDPNPLNRTMVYALNPKNTKEANDYNEKIYKDYLVNPEKVIYLRYKRIMEFNPQKIYDLKDDELKLAEFYRDNYPLCDEAFAFASVVNRSEITPALNNSLKSISQPIENLAYPQLMVNAAHDLEYFAIPKVNKEQADITMNKNRELMLNASPSMINALNDALVHESVDSPHTFFGKFLENGQKFEHGYFVKHRTEKVTMQNGQPVIKEVGYDEVFDNSKSGQVRITDRSEDDIFEMQCMNKTVQREYILNWQNDLNNRLGRNRNFDVDDMLKERQGGFIERRILHSTSQEYKNFEQAFRDYNDPNSPNYCRSNYLREATDAYLNHKGVTDESDLENMSGTSRSRSQFALAVRESLKEKDKLLGMVEEQWLDEYQVQVSKEPFLSAEDVAEDKGIDVKEMGNEMQKDLELEDDLNESMDL